MRKTTKFAALLLAVMMILSCVPMMASAAGATNTIAVGTADALPGATNVVVPVNVTGSFCAMQINLTYDTALTLTAVDCGDDDGITSTFGTEAFVAGKIGLIVEAAGAEDRTNATFNLVFTAPDAENTYAVNFVDVDAADVEENTITFDGSNGAVVVAAAATEPVLDPDIKFIGTSMQFSLQLGIAYNINPSVIYQKYDHYDVEVTRTVYDSSFNEVAGTPQKATITPVINTLAVAVFSGIGMCELGLDIKAVIKCYDADDNFVAYSETNTLSAADALVQLYNSKASSTKPDDIKMRPLLVDTLNMGAEAQKYFAAQKVADGSDLKADVAAGNLVNKNIPQTYATEELGQLNTTNTGTWVPGAAFTGSFANSVSFKNTPVTAFVLMGANVADKVNDLSFELSYTSKGVKGGPDKTFTKTCTGSDWELNAASKALVVCNFSDMFMYDLDKTITATLKYQGNVVWSGEYSAEAFISSNLDNASTGGLATALGKFGVSARNYFC